MITQSIIPCIWFEGDVEAIAEWYVSKFPDSFVDYTTKLTDTPSGETTVVTVSLAGQFCQLLGAGPLKERNPSISYMVTFPTSEEVETLWSELIDGAEVLMPLDTYDFSERYGWLKDKHGVSWQIVPWEMEEMLMTGTKEQLARVTEAFLPMKKIDVATLRKVY
ncbi:VOC family protein [Exiguobacterium sp. s150]|uniref:VOC family protein n=1 Tax=Exiguobacterium sp. s150 TaxID=2751221 RepID=UPI001BEC9D0D|nr:VOC family protein [Exiguobacterium sp. s150]